MHSDDDEDTRDDDEDDDDDNFVPISLGFYFLTWVLPVHSAGKLSGELGSYLGTPNWLQISILSHCIPRTAICLLYLYSNTFYWYFQSTHFPQYQEIL